MTTYVQARDSIVTLLHTNLSADKPYLPVYWENTTAIDLDMAADPFIRITIEFDDAEQMTINNTPERRVYGDLFITVFTKTGRGTRHVLELFDYLENVVKYRNTGQVCLLTPQAGRKVEQGGWVAHVLRAPFFFDSMVWA